jgi:RNA polymerase sigma-70 factor (ECF subfamily)
VNEESRLIDEARRGRPAAFGQLVHLHQDRLFNAMAHFIGDPVEAEDIVQEAFVQAYLKLSSFQQHSAFYTWLYRIAFNTAVSRQRKKRVETSVDLTRERSGEEPLDRGELPEERLEREEQVQQLHHALSQLSDEHRAILVLRELEGCDYEAIAEVLAINIGTVRSRLHRARLQLREKLEQLESEQSSKRS